VDLIDDTLLAQRIHLLGGVSDAGKTRWGIPAFLDWEQGLPVLGRNSHPVPWAYVAGDRDEIELYDSLNTMGLPKNCLRVIPAFGRQRKGYLQVLEAAASMRPIPEFLFWEGFSDLPDGERKVHIAEFLGIMSSYCPPSKQFPNGLAYLGVVESPKQKPYERYPNPRQRISGCSAWAYHSSTVILIEGTAKDLALETDQRDFWVCAKNAKRRRLNACFDARGRLIVP